MNKKIILVILVIMNILLTSASAVTEKDVNKMKNEFKAQELEQYIVRITSLGLGLSSCSGVIIKNDMERTTVLTCKHCIIPTFEMYVDDVKVLTVHTNTKDDLAYLILDRPLQNKKAVKLANIKPEIDSQIYMLGKPGFSITYYKSGQIKKYTNDWGFAKLDVIGGCSGTGVFNDLNELVGIVWGKYVEGEEGGGFFEPGIGGIGIGIFEPLNDVRDFLRLMHKILK